MPTYRIMTVNGIHGNCYSGKDEAEIVALAEKDGYEIIDVVDDILVIEDVPWPDDEVP